MGATDLVTFGTYVWPSGHEVASELWSSNEGPNAKERCTSIITWGGKTMGNFNCDDKEVLNVIVCAIPMEYVD